MTLRNAYSLHRGVEKTVIDRPVSSALTGERVKGFNIYLGRGAAPANVCVVVKESLLNDDTPIKETRSPTEKRTEHDDSVVTACGFRYLDCCMIGVLFRAMMYAPSRDTPYPYRANVYDVETYRCARECFRGRCKCLRSISPVLALKVAIRRLTRHRSIHVLLRRSAFYTRMLVWIYHLRGKGI